MRDQANKTFDLYLHRVRKYGTSLPESALPPTTMNGNLPHMGISQKGASQSENSWSGWAISSFTNKLAAATGEIQAKTSTQPRAQSTDGRPSISPLTGNSSRPAHTEPSLLPNVMRRTANATTPDLPSTSTDQLFTDAQDEDEDLDDAWGDIAEDSFFDAPSESKAEPAISTAPKPTPTPMPIAPFDDGGEPDFEGWLKAQMQSKTKSKQALPKGLVKSATTQNKPAAPVRINSTGGNSGVLGAGAKKLPITTTTAAKPKVTTSSTLISTKANNHGATDDDWGDAWD